MPTDCRSSNIVFVETNPLDKVHLLISDAFWLGFRCSKHFIQLISIHGFNILPEEDGGREPANASPMGKYLSKYLFRGVGRNKQATNCRI